MTRIAALLLLAILAHFMLMTSTVGAEAHQHATHAKSTLVTKTLVTDPVHEFFCFTAQLAVKSAPTLLQSGDQAAPLPLNELAVASATRANTTPPHRPPNVVRALLQVYRI